MYAFRWRCGQRMIEESRHLKMQPLQLKSKRRHTPQSSPRRSISPRSHRTSQYSPRASLTLNQEEEEDLTENNEEEEAVAASDERLFSVDYEHTRPDLAPFSTMIHNMIQHVARQHHHVVTTESDLLTSIRDRHRDDEVHDEPLSSRTLYSPRIDLLRSAMTTPGPAEQQNISISASPSRPQSRAEQWSEFQDRMISTASSTSSRRMKSRIEMDSHVPVNIETVGHLWEEMAQVNTSIAETKALLKDNGSTGGGSSGRRKSSAYLALEKLCGLKEEDIQRQNERFKSKRHHVNNSFLNSNLLR